MESLMETAARALGIPLSALEDEIERMRAARQRRVANQNARFDAALEKVTDVQQAVMNKLVAQGFKANASIWTNPKTGNVARTFFKPVWDSAKGRMGMRLTTVYPDGSMQTTMEKKISIRPNF